MPTGGYQIRDQYAIHFLTFAVVEWLDVFTRKEYIDIVLDSLRHCQKEKGLKIHAWCIMTNHVHMIASSDGKHTLSDILRDLKKYTSSQVIKAIEDNPRESRRNWMLWIFKSAGAKNTRNDNYQFWQQDNHPEECFSTAMLESKMKYIHENPLRAGFVRNEWDYMYRVL
jgi:putative transposase